MGWRSVGGLTLGLGVDAKWMMDDDDRDHFWMMAYKYFQFIL